MAKPTKLPSDAAAELTARERLVLFCAASGTDWVQARTLRDALSKAIAHGYSGG
jgi:hypothetical protein